MSESSNAPKRAIIYTRVSSDPSGRRVSVASQEAENRAFCQRQGWTVVDVVTDNDRSASRFAVQQREGYREVQRRLAAREADILVCWEAARAQRDLAEYVVLRQLCVDHHVGLAYKGQLYDLTKADDRLRTGFDALMAEREADDISERTKRGIRAKVVEGRPHGTVPYGYARVYDHTRALVDQVPDPQTAPVVQEIVARVIAGDTLFGICQSLNRRAVPTPQQYKDRLAGRVVDRAGWSPPMLRRMLASTSMIGVRSHLGAANPEPSWQPIVDPNDYLLARAVLADPRRGAHHRGVAPKHLLSGIAECGVCGAKVRPFTNGGRPSYACRGRADMGRSHVVRQRPAMDLLVEEAVLAFFDRPDIPTLLVADQGDEQAAAAARELAELQARLELWRARASELSPETLVRVEADLLPRIEAARQRTVLPAAPAVVRHLADGDHRRVWEEDFDVTQRRQVIRYLLRVVVQPSGQKPGQRGFDPRFVEIHWLIGDGSGG